MRPAAADQRKQIATSPLFPGVIGATDRRPWLRAVMAVPVAVWLRLVAESEFRPGPQMNVLMVTTSMVLLFGGMITLLVENIGAVDAWYARLVKAGAGVPAAPEPMGRFGIYSFFCADPNGYVIEVQTFL